MILFYFSHARSSSYSLFAETWPELEKQEGNERNDQRSEQQPEVDRHAEAGRQVLLVYGRDGSVSARLGLGFVIAGALHQREQTRQETADSLADVQTCDVVAAKVAHIREEHYSACAVQNGETENAREERDRLLLAKHVTRVVPEEREHGARNETDRE